MTTPGIRSPQHLPTCPRCGNAMRSDLAAYDESGALVCNGCHAAQTVSALQQTTIDEDPLSKKNLWGRSATSATLGCATIVMLLFFGAFAFILAPIGIFMGVHTTLHLLREPAAKKALGAGWPGALALAVAGAVLGVLGTGLGLVLVFLF